MQNYDPSTIESKWNEEWYKHNIYEAVDLDPRPKKYILAELPYPSGKSLHLGHMMRFTLPDVYSRYLRMRGFNVLFPMGWDAFGLPAENYAIKTGVHPDKFIHETIEGYKKSIRRMGYSIDWNREIDTTDPKYYKWTQWIFLKLWKAGLAEYKSTSVWWCEDLKIVLSDEEVLSDKKGNKISERGGFPVTKKNVTQWILKITNYADKLLEGLDEVDFPEAIKNAQRNWIGRKDGIVIDYEIKDLADRTISIFTTRPDTNFGATFVAIAPEHPIAQELSKNGNRDISNYIAKAKNKSELERISEGSKKTGVFTGLYAINKLTNKEIPIWISDFVLAGFGTGALVGVPGHDKRDFAFAKQFDLEVIRVVVGNDGDSSPITKLGQVQEEEGVMVNSQFLNGLDIHEATIKMMDFLEEKGWGKRKKVFSMRDWVFSRQRYWGEPIPLIHNSDGTIEAICDPDDTTEVEKCLPLKLPDVPDYNPTSDGSSPLQKNKKWLETKNKAGDPATRETNTMPQWAGSCWYYIRYIDPKNDSEFADRKKLDYWLPVDRYFGGAEHTTLHLLYSRFWHRFLYDQNLVGTKEPYAWRLNGGLLLGPDGRKMSKSLGNVVEPTALLDKFGADALRMFIPFLGPYEDTYPLNDNAIKATYKLLATINSFKQKVKPGFVADNQTKIKFNNLVKNVGEMFEDLKMNTAVSEFMIFVNHLKNKDFVELEMWKDFLKTLAPFAAFLAEDLWQEINGFTEFKKENSVHLQKWPVYDAKLTEVKVTEIGVQVNGKIRASVTVDEADTEETISQKLQTIEKLKPYIINKPIKKLIYIPGKIVNVVN